MAMIPIQAQHIESITNIIKHEAANLIEINLATEEQDTQQATDIVVATSVGTIAVRVRTYRSTIAKGYRDFTIRTRSCLGNRTEIDKLREGFAKWYIYAWEDDSGKIDQYILVDMDIVRDQRLLDVARRDISNGDGTMFCAISIDELVVAKCLISYRLALPLPHSMRPPKSQQDMLFDL